MEGFVVAFYIRLSMEDKNKNEMEQSESNSIINQRNLLFDYVNEREEFRGAKIETYVDDGYTGTNFERPAMKNLLEKVKEGGVGCILVKDFSRFGRNYIMVTDYIDQIFPFLGVRFISVNDQFDTGTLNGKTSGIEVGFKNIIMSYYSHDLSVKIKTASRNKAKQGYYINANAIMGYRKVEGDKNKIEIYPEAAQVVQRIFAMVIEGERVSDIAKILNKEGVPTPLYFQRQQGRFMNSKTNTDKVYWSGSSVGYIVRNPQYLGTYYYGKTTSIEVGSLKWKKSKEEDVIKVEQAYEPLVTKEDFEKAQKVLERNGYKKTERLNGITPHLFSKKLRCGECKSLLEKIALKSGNSYQCAKWERIDRKCFRKRRKEKELASVVLCVLKSYMQTYLEKQKESRLPNGIADKKKQLKIYGRRVKKLEEEKVILYDKKISKEISEKEYLQWKVEKDRLQEELCDKIAILEELEELQQDKHLLDTNLLESYLQMEELTREMMDCFIDCIYVYEDYIHINWKFEVDASYTEKEIFF
ncbi:MAG: recombinase family protein [Eubacteriales bacterium]